VQVALTNVGHYGQIIYLDNVNIRVTAPPIGIGTIEEANQVTVFPNPAHDAMTIKAEGLKGNSVTLSCYNSVGRMVLHRSENLNNGSLNTTLNLAGIPVGVYELKIQGEAGESIVKKIVVD
jgi:hypothetical protein